MSVKAKFDASVSILIFKTELKWTRIDAFIKILQSRVNIFCISAEKLNDLNFLSFLLSFMRSVNDSVIYE